MRTIQVSLKNPLKWRFIAAQVVGPLFAVGFVMFATRLLFFGIAVVGACALGCAIPADDNEAEASSADAIEAVIQSAAKSFAMKYVFFPGSAPTKLLPHDQLMAQLPEGDALDTATCLGARRDIVRGDTLEGGTWSYTNRDGVMRFFMLEVALEPRPQMSDPIMIFAFTENGEAAFQALTWSKRHSIQLYYHLGSPCAVDEPGRDTHAPDHL